MTGIMKKLLLLPLLFCNCLAHSRTARFVDGTEGQAAAWICVQDDASANKGGVACAEMTSVLRVTGKTICDDMAPPSPQASP